MDITTIGGLIAAGVIVTIVMVMDGGSPAELFTAPQAILLTVGGAFIATLISYPVKSLGLIPKWFAIAFKGQNLNTMEAIDAITRMADKARREGLLALEEESKKTDDEFMRKGLMMVVDGMDPEQVRGILELEIKHMRERHAQGYGFFNAAGGYGPTMGIIGTVMGLISVLQELSNPGELGHSIAVAFLATLWGILSANVFWLPIGNKLSNKSEAEAAYRHLVVEGILALQAGENPRVVHDKLLAFIPPKERQAEGAPAAAGQKARAGA